MVGESSEPGACRQARSNMNWSEFAASFHDFGPRVFLLNYVSGRRTVSVYAATALEWSAHTWSGPQALGPVRRSVDSIELGPSVRTPF